VWVNASDLTAFGLFFFKTHGDNCSVEQGRARGRAALIPLAGSSKKVQAEIRYLRNDAIATKKMGGIDFHLSRPFMKLTPVTGSAC
jgi:hypothetical protein